MNLFSNHPKIFSHLFSLGLLILFLVPINLLILNTNNNNQGLSQTDVIPKNTLDSLQNRLAQTSTLSSSNTYDKHTYLINLLNNQVKNNLINYLIKNNFIIVNDLTNLNILVVNGPSNIIPLIKDHFNVEITENTEWQGFPNPLTSYNQSNLLDFTQSVSYINPRSTIKANGVSLTGKNVKIAIMDTGIDSTHPDFNNRIIENISFLSPQNGYSCSSSNNDCTSTEDYNGHGTHVSGIAAGSGSSNSLYMGIAPEASIIMYKVGDMRGGITQAGVLSALNRAITDHVDIISMSFGFSGDQPDSLLAKSIDEVVAMGTNVIISAGNSGPDNGTINTPATARLAIAVGAYNSYDGKVADFSSRGLTTDGRIKPDVVAPGVEVIAPLSQGSLIQLSSEYFNPSPIYSTNYVALSGTSMAAPVVAGAIALIKEAIPDASPMAIKSALMKDAKDIGQMDNVQGAGLINIQQTITTLESGSASNNFDYLPQKAIIQNTEIPSIIFPTDSYVFRFTFFSEINNDFSIQVPNATLSSILNVSQEQTQKYNSSFGYYTEIKVAINPSVTTLQGAYSGILSLKVNNQIISNMTLTPIRITEPKIKIYWSIFHTDGSDSITSNFKNLATKLRSDNVFIKEFDALLSLEDLSQFDILVIPDSSTAFFPQEFTAIKEYMARGGNVIVLGSYIPFINYDNLNTFLNQFGMSFSDNSDVNFTNSGIYADISPPNETNVSFNTSSPLNKDVTSLFWYYGTYLMINNPNIISLASVTNNSNSYPVYALFNGNNTYPGKLLLTGQEMMLFNSYINEGNNYQFIKNSVEDFATKPNDLVVAFNSSLVPQNTVQNFTIKYSENLNFIKLTSSDKLNITITNPSKNNSTNLVNYNETLQAFTIGQSFSQVGIYIFNFTFNSITKIIKVKVYDSTVSWDITADSQTKISPLDSQKYPSYLSPEYGIPVFPYGANVIFQVNSSAVYTGTNTPIVIITYMPEIGYGLSQTKIPYTNIINLEVPYQINTGNIYSYNLTIPNNFPVGLYIVQFYQKLNDNENWNGYNYQFFAVNDQIPQIDNSKSVLGGKDPLYNYSLNNPNGNFLQISPGQNLELDIYATSETKGTPFTVTILYTPLYVFLDENYVYNISNIPQQSPTYFKGTFTVPENSTINLKSGYDINLGGGHYILIDIVLSDGAGNLDEMPIVALLQTSSSGFDNLFLPIFFVLILFPLVILFYMMYRSSKKHTDEDMYFRLQQQQRYLNQLRNPPLTNNNQPPPLNQPPEDKFTPRFCGNCGSQVAPGESFCLECGKKI